jgi:hypothetical protein
VTLRTISYGGGVQSTALVILAAQRDERLAEIMGGQVDAAIMANVGDDSEHPDAIRWVRDVVKPWTDQHRFQLFEVARTRRDGTPYPTLLQDVLREDTRSVNIPARMANGSPGNRNCTSEWKIKQIAKWHKAHGATADDPAIVAVGISTDEIQRVTTRRRNPHEQVVYPLIELGMDRSACQRLNVETFGAPAPKSSCWFCPFHKPQRFAEMRRDEPELFAQAVELERAINRKRARIGKDEVFLTRFAKPLDVAISEAQTPLFTDDTWSDPGEAGCDSGACFT